MKSIDKEFCIKSRFGGKIDHKSIPGNEHHSHTRHILLQYEEVFRKL